MLIKNEKAKDGYEEVVALFDKIIGGIDEAKAKEIAAVEQKYADRRAKYVTDRKLYVEVEEIEVPDPEPVVEESVQDETAALINDITGDIINA